MVGVVKDRHLEAWTNWRPLYERATITAIGTPAWMGRTADLEADTLADVEALSGGSEWDQEPPTAIGLLLATGSINP